MREFAVEFITRASVFSGLFNLEVWSVETIVVLPTRSAGGNGTSPVSSPERSVVLDTMSTDVKVTFAVPFPGASAVFLRISAGLLMFSNIAVSLTGPFAGSEV